MPQKLLTIILTLVILSSFAFLQVASDSKKLDQISRDFDRHQTIINDMPKAGSCWHYNACTPGSCDEVNACPPTSGVGEAYNCLPACKLSTRF